MGGVSPRSSFATASSLGNRFLTELEKSFSEEVQHVLLNERRLTTRKCYELKWKRFCLWDANKDNDLVSAPKQSILEYLLLLKDHDSSFKSLRLHLATIAAFHTPVDGKSMFSHQIKRFMKGLLNI